MQLGRNDECSCGSGLKFKKCCLNKKKVYDFKVTPLYFDNFTCTIRLTEAETLCDLHDTLQRALNWDNDHMYSFFMDNKFWNRNSEYSANPLGEGNADIQLKLLNLVESQKFAYLFDYGDEHRFEVEVGQILLVDDVSKHRTGIIQKTGKPIEQYNYPEEDFDLEFSEAKEESVIHETP